ncbi:unnamed protein product [Protopolystoma xenopodis]|uniref:Uncharacterized protein n=1 Tax=Protopolystoma xenopodis TaxID=117903 RepID=A0A3S5BYX0_9PLAT|nr:unnamed protein product [Protopolystoma xenopodis]
MSHKSPVSPLHLAAFAQAAIICFLVAMPLTIVSISFCVYAQHCRALGKRISHAHSAGEAIIFAGASADNAHILVCCSNFRRPHFRDAEEEATTLCTKRRKNWVTKLDPTRLPNQATKLKFCEALLQSSVWQDLSLKPVSLAGTVSTSSGRFT